MNTYVKKINVSIPTKQRNTSSTNFTSSVKKNDYSGMSSQMPTCS